MNKNTEAFLGLLKAGLWADVESTDLRNQGFVEPVDWEEVYRLAEEQSVIGVVLAGIETSKEKPSQELLLQWIGEVQLIEQQNKAMNELIVYLMQLFQEKGVMALLVKGQGVAQCYEKPFWRVSGDVDLILDAENYTKAKDILLPMADSADPEDVSKMDQAITIRGFLVELHGRMPFGMSKRVDRVIKSVFTDALKQDGVTTSMLDGKDVFLPNADNHLLLVFTHFLRHFFIEGVGLRQICDWNRMLWKFKDKLDYGLLESRIRKAGVMTEWKAFASFAVDKLGMPIEAMPFYDSRFKGKGEKIFKRVLRSGNFGHNNDLSYRTKYSGMTYKLVALWRRIKDFAVFTTIFPIDAPKFFVNYVMRKV